jgi:hypothetical protein
VADPLLERDQLIAAVEFAAQAARSYLERLAVDDVVLAGSEAARALA